MATAKTIYNGLAEVGFPLSVMSSVVVTIVSGFVIYTAVQIKKGLVNPPPTAPGKEPLTPNELGNMMIGIASVMVVMSWIWTYLAHRYKTISAISAAGSVLTLVSSLLHWKHVC